MKKIIGSMTSFALVALMLFSISASAYANDYNLSELTVGQDLEVIQHSDTEYNPAIMIRATRFMCMAKMKHLLFWIVTLTIRCGYITFTPSDCKIMF